MGSREEIFEKLRRNTREVHEYPDLSPLEREALVIVLDRNAVVDNMHQAYAALEEAEAPSFGTFISGPSKTADIEQALVFGAHGARSIVVVLV